jgi:hypothetical protein
MRLCSVLLGLGWLAEAPGHAAGCVHYEVSSKLDVPATLIDERHICISWCASISAQLRWRTVVAMHQGLDRCIVWSADWQMVGEGVLCSVADASCMLRRALRWSLGHI